MKPAPAPRARPQTGLVPLVVVGCSAGGLDAMKALLGGLPPRFAWAIAMVQHSLRGSPGGLLVEALAPHLRLPLEQALDKTARRAGHAVLAPPDYHLLVEEDHYALSVDEPVAWSRPAIDVLFESAAEALGPAVTGVLLTGANADGARGLERIKALGGRAAVQDPACAEHPAMPRAALERLGRERLDRLAPAREIGQWLVHIAQPRKGAP